MVFNSLTFVLFLAIVYSIYWGLLINNRKHQNILLLIASNLFYGFWDFRFLFLLNFSILLDYTSGILIEKEKKINKRKIILLISIITNLSLLIFFKYFTFLAETIMNLLQIDSNKNSIYHLNIILPVGISFYTFHGLSYVIDIYNKRIKAEFDLNKYALFVSFFPLLVAGPIERATHLLPQISNVKKQFQQSETSVALRFILWGFFKKIVIADNCAFFSNSIFDNYLHYNGITLFVGACFFAFQIYCDFSAYSDIAYGVAKLFGYEILTNFSSPYLSRNIIEFWKSWHISLTTWFRDYLYFSIGGNRKHEYRNILIVFLVSGLWHGANWTFFLWGLYNGLLIIFTKAWINKKYNSKKPDSFSFSLNNLVALTITFCLVTIGWIFFRSETIEKSFKIISTIFSNSFFNIPVFENGTTSLKFIFIIILMMLIEMIARKKNMNNPIYLIENIKVRWVRFTLYYTLIFAILWLGTYTESSFIYFQF